MSYEASSYRRSSGSRYRERDERDSYRRHESRRSEKYQPYEERRGRYASIRRRSPSSDRYDDRYYDDYRDRRRRSYSRERSRDRHRYSDSRSRSRSPRDRRRHRRGSVERRRSSSVEECPPSPPKFPRMSSPGRNNSDSSDDNAAENSGQSVKSYSEDTNGLELSEEYFGDIEANKEKIHQAMEERLRQHLAAQGKVYPPPKPEPQQTTMFANDGSFMEMFKRMQEQQKPSTSSGAQSETKKPPAPLFGKRRGGKILKTGIVEKKKPTEEVTPPPGSTDAWSLYMMEVKKYKNFSCDIDNNSRPLVK
ncbi:uncharacterized protein LOC129790032 [Lutzomyia longipalpis]|nr:uncharacterized protein LOC129790032 [Lutzomyia longipalpis]XP_055683172.1 uncharacterized protein LOC129790032 [Lutzomyia longipalpis]XP_055683173.1 uncharacterized protein LOC129790032 [Lutzomyia longipalpis]